MRFGQAHGAGPAAFQYRAQEGFLLPGFAVLFQRFHDAMREQGVVAPGKIRCVQHFLDQYAQGFRQVLSAHVFGRGQSGPTAFDELGIGFAEAGRRRDLAGGLVELAADLVADAIGRSEDLLGELRGFLQHRVHDVALGVVDAELRELLFAFQHVVQGELHVAHRSGVTVHAMGSWVRSVFSA